jgi:hypothetical protein
MVGGAIALLLRQLKPTSGPVQTHHGRSQRRPWWGLVLGAKIFALSLPLLLSTKISRRRSVQNLTIHSVSTTQHTARWPSGLRRQVQVHLNSA